MPTGGAYHGDGADGRERNDVHGHLQGHTPSHRLLRCLVDADGEEQVTIRGVHIHHAGGSVSTLRQTTDGRGAR
eukprot:1299682-Rhodomonas_salina.2